MQHTTKRICKACSEPNFVDKEPQFPFSTEKCAKCSWLNHSEAQFPPIRKDGTTDTSEDEDSDNAVTILPAIPLKQPHNIIERSMEQTITERGSLSSLMTSRMKLPLRPKVFPENKTKYIKFLVKKPLDIKQQLNSILSRAQQPFTVISNCNSILKDQQSDSAVQDQFSPIRSSESIENETYVKHPDTDSPLKSSTDLFRGFSPLPEGPDALVFDDPDSDGDIDVGSDTLSYCTPVRSSTLKISDERIVEFDYNNSQMNYKKPSPPVVQNVDKLLKPAYHHNTMKRKSEPYRLPVLPPVMSLYASQLQHNYRKTRKTYTIRPPKIRALHGKNPVRSIALENIINDLTLLKQEDNTSSERCFDKDFLAEPTIPNSENTLMSLSIHNFFAGEDITLEDILTKYY